MSRNVSGRTRFLLGALGGMALCALSGAVPAADAVSAKKMALQESCLHCHAVDKKKEGPAYQAIAYKYKGQADALDKLVTHITSGQKVKLTDGHEEEHKIAKTKDPEQIRNLIGWILAQ